VNVWGGEHKSEPLQEIIDSQSKLGGTINVLPGPPLYVNGSVKIPAGKDVIIRRDLIGSSAAEILICDRTNLSFEDCQIKDVPLKLISGSIAISGFNYFGRAHLSAISICGPGPYYNIRLEHFYIADANYGILRQGAKSCLKGAFIHNGVFKRLSGDAIEWNVCPNDIGVIIDGHYIEGIDAPRGHPFWGIGVGVSGRSYSPNWDPSLSAKKFIIRKITGRFLRQLIHVEAGVDFSIEDIEGKNIGPEFSEGSGLDVGAVVCYGCNDFTISEVVADEKVLIACGVSNDKYVVPSANFTLDKIYLSDGDLRMDVGGQSSFVKLTNVKLDSGAIKIRGAVSDLELNGVSVSSPRALVAPFTSDPKFLSGNLASFCPVSSIERMHNVHFHRGRN
jgi:colanic acid biosynthesis protein WcaM